MTTKALGDFKDSAAFSLGVELELQLVSKRDFDLTRGATDLLGSLDYDERFGEIKLEITESMIEISTQPQATVDGIAADLGGLRDTLRQHCERNNIGVCGGGTHPFQRWSDQRISAKPRFMQLSGLYGYLAKQFTVFGQHVHIGCASANQSLYLLHALNRYLPHFIALSASSPFFQGVDTRFDSARLNSVFAFPLSGRAPLIFEWEEFEHDYFAKMEKTGVVEGMKDFYWDIRPKPEYGTIELRVCDTPLTVDRAAALAAYLQALCRMLLQGEEPDPVEDDYLVYNYNRFQACRFGLDGVLVHPRSNRSLSLRDDILATVGRLAPHAAALGSEAALDELQQEVVSQGNHASFLRQQFVEVGSVQGMVDAAVTLFRKGRSK